MLDIINLFSNVWANLISSIIILLLGMITSQIPKLIRTRKATKFFGNSLQDNHLRIVYGFYSRLDARSQSDSEKYAPRCQKMFHDGTLIKVRGPRQFSGKYDLFAGFSIIQELRKYTKTSIKAISDEEAFQELNNTFVLIGGPMSNELTRLALNDENNHFLEWTIPDDLQKWDNYFKINENNETIKFEPINHGQDYGVILKIRNKRFPKHNFILCAGIGGWGTSGAGWFLSNKWKELYKKFGSNDFVVVLEVHHGSNSSSKIIYSKFQ